MNTAVVDPRFAARLAAHNAGLVFPREDALERLGAKLATCQPNDIPFLHLEVAQELGLPASVEIKHGKPVAEFGVLGPIIVVSDCLTPGANNTETSLRSVGISSNCFGDARQRLVPSGKVHYFGTPPYDADPLSFAFASFLARNEVTAEARDVKKGPTIFIGNAAKRDEQYPKGAPFLMGLFKGNVVGILSSFEAFADAHHHGYLVSDKLWEIDIEGIIGRNSRLLDLYSHYRSQFLECVAADWALGKEVIKCAHSVDNIPKPHQATIVPGEYIKTKIALFDDFGNFKLRLFKDELEAAQLSGELMMMIDNKPFPVRITGAISQGDDKHAVLVGSSTWHGLMNVAGEDAVTRNYVDAFIRMDDLREHFGELLGGRLPRPGDEVTIYKAGNRA